MAELKLYRGMDLFAWLDTSQPHSKAAVIEIGVYRSGPIVSRLETGKGEMPAGTLLYGQLWMNEKERVAYGRWTEAELPGSRKRVPVCLILGGFAGRRDGVEWEEGSTPGAVRLLKLLAFEVVHRWP
jgi:serine/threonine-protein kinase